MTDGGRNERLADLVWIAFALAVVPNTLESFGAPPDNDWWTVVRVVLSTLFAIALVAYLAGRCGARRRRR